MHQSAKGTPVPNEQEASWIREPAWTLRAEKILVPLPKIEPRSLCHPSLGSISITNTLNWLLYYNALYGTRCGTCDQIQPAQNTLHCRASRNAVMDFLLS